MGENLEIKSKQWQADDKMAEIMLGQTTWR